jgi:hypothetical protein
MPTVLDSVSVDYDHLPKLEGRIGQCMVKPLDQLSLSGTRPIVDTAALGRALA